MNRKYLSQLISKFFRLGVGTPLTGLPTAMQVDGNIAEANSLVPTLGMLITAINAAPLQVNFQNTAGATYLLTNLQNATILFSAGSAVGCTADYAYNIANAVQNPFVGQTFGMRIATTTGSTAATPLLLCSAVTLAGTTQVSANSIREYSITFTQIASTSGVAVTSGTTFTSLTQVGTTNAYTLALGTNAVTPTPGQVIYITVTAGTLPSGWYPIEKVTSATSFVILAPISGTAFTCTAATLPGTSTVPASQYTTGFTGVFAPLVTITGRYQISGTVTA